MAPQWLRNAIVLERWRPPADWELAARALCLSRCCRRAWRRHPHLLLIQVLGIFLVPVIFQVVLLIQVSVVGWVLVVFQVPVLFQVPGVFWLTSVHQASGDLQLLGLAAALVQRHRRRRRSRPEACWSRDTCGSSPNPAEGFAEITSCRFCRTGRFRCGTVP